MAPSKDNKDFASQGTESYGLDDGIKKERVILNIEREKISTLSLKKLKKNRFSGSLLNVFEKINLYMIEHSSVKVKEKATFFHLLSVMINAGIPMIRALRSLVSQMADNPKMAMIMEKIAEDVESGTSLSESFLIHDDVFNEQEIGMVQSGEASGQLTNVLENLASDAEKAHDIKSKIKNAMLYPIVIVLLLIAVVAAMMIFVIPMLKTLFESGGQELPLVTKIVVGISDAMFDYKYLIVAGTLGLIMFGIMFGKTDTGKYTYDRIKISIPIFGPLFKKAYLSRFARAMSNLLDSNISVIKALEITAHSIGNEVYTRRLLLSVEDIRQGIPMAESLTESPLFPPMMVSMIEVGEQTAQIPEITGKIAEFYEREVDNSVAGISKIIEPVILIVIGGTVAVVVAAIMIPIVRISNVTGVL